MAPRPKLPSSKEAEILDLLLSGREMYGLEMIRESGGGLKRGTIYVLLDRLQDQGFVSSRKEETSDASGLARRYYRITGQGQRALQAHRDAQNRWVLPGTLAGA